MKKVIVICNYASRVSTHANLDLGAFEAALPSDSLALIQDECLDSPD